MEIKDLLLSYGYHVRLVKANNGLWQYVLMFKDEIGNSYFILYYSVCFERLYLSSNTSRLPISL